MNKLSNHLLTYLFRYFSRFYRPWFRLVCKRWSTLITERICHITSIVKHSDNISIPLWFEFAKYVPLTSPRYLRLLCLKPPGPNKLHQLQLALTMNLPLPKHLNAIDIPDFETLTFLLEHGVDVNIVGLKRTSASIGGTNGWRLTLNDVALINWYQEQGLNFYLGNQCNLSMRDIETLNLDQTSKFYLYVRNGYFPSFLLPNNINPCKLFCCAISSQSLDLMKYLLLKYPTIKIRTYHYLLTKNNTPLSQFLYNCPQQSSFNPRHLKSLNRLAHLSELIKRNYWRPTVSAYIWALAYGFDDVLTFLEWHCPQPNIDILDSSVDYCQKHAIFDVEYDLPMLKWCLNKHLIFSKKVFDSHLPSFYS